MTRAETIHAHRARLGLSRSKYAAYLGVAVQNIVNWEGGKREPSDAAMRLVEVLQVVETLAPGIAQALIPQASSIDAGS